MFIFVIAANIVAALMVCCGGIQMYHVIISAQRTQGANLFFSQLGEASLPLLGGVILYGILQIAQLLETISLQQQVSEIEKIAPPVKPKVKKKVTEPVSEPFFGTAVVEPDPEPPKKRALPPIPELEIITDPDEPQRKPVEEDDDGMSFFRMS